MQCHRIGDWWTINLCLSVCNITHTHTHTNDSSHETTKVLKQRKTLLLIDALVDLKWKSGSENCEKERSDT